MLARCLDLLVGQRCEGWAWWWVVRRAFAPSLVAARVLMPASTCSSLRMAAAQNQSRQSAFAPRRCPMLCALGVTMTDADFFFPVVKSHMNRAGCTLQHLQLCLALDLYALVEHRVVGRLSCFATPPAWSAQYALGSLLPVHVKIGRGCLKICGGGQPVSQLGCSALLSAMVQARPQCKGPYWPMAQIAFAGHFSKRPPCRACARLSDSRCAPCVPQWESVGHITSLLTLQIIFADYDNQPDLDEQVRCLITCGVK